MATERGADIDDVDGLGIEGFSGGTELVRTVLVSVYGLVRDRSGEEEENARGEGGGGVEDGEGKVGQRGERFGDREFAHGGTERRFTASREPPKKGGRGGGSEVRRVDTAGGGVEGEGGGGGGKEGSDSSD